MSIFKFKSYSIEWLFSFYHLSFLFAVHQISVVSFRYTFKFVEKYTIMMIEHNGQYYDIEYSETRNEVVATVDGLHKYHFEKQGISDEILTLKIEMAPFDEVQEAYHTQFGNELLKMLENEI